MLRPNVRKKVKIPKSKQSSHIVLSDDKGDIPVSILYSRRKTVQCSISADRTVIVRAPYYISARELNRILEQRRSWIRDKLQQQASVVYLAHGKSYHAGEQHFFLGEAYPLHMCQGALQTVHLTADTFKITVRDSQDQEKVKSLLYTWYREQAEQNIRPRAEEILRSLSYYQLPQVKIVFRKMSRRWGSCSVKNIITLNIELMKVPKNCIDYVIYHEIAHLKHMDHGKGFYQFLDQICPQAQKAKAQLDRYRI